MTKSNYHDDRTRDRCYFCGAAGELEEHHVIPQRFDGPDSLENIVELCPSCHTKLERLYDKSFYEYFGIEDEEGKRLFQRACQTHDCNRVAEVKANGPLVDSLYLCEDCLVERAKKWQRREGYIAYRDKTVDEIVEDAIVERADPD